MTQIQDEQALLPCPFCGYAPHEDRDTGDVRCTEYECTGMEAGWATRKAWNTRSLPALIAAAKGMGYAVVPVEPSEAMLQRGAQSISVSFSDESWAIALGRRMYRAMLTASQGV